MPAVSRVLVAAHHTHVMALLVRENHGRGDACDGVHSVRGAQCVRQLGVCLSAADAVETAAAVARHVCVNLHTCTHVASVRVALRGFAVAVAVPSPTVRNSRVWFCSWLQDVMKIGLQDKGGLIAYTRQEPHMNNPITIQVSSTLVDNEWTKVSSHSVVNDHIDPVPFQTTDYITRYASPLPLLLLQLLSALMSMSPSTLVLCRRRAHRSHIVHALRCGAQDAAVVRQLEEPPSGRVEHRQRCPAAADVREAEVRPHERDGAAGRVRGGLRRREVHEGRHRPADERLARWRGASSVGVSFIIALCRVAGVRGTSRRAPHAHRIAASPQMCIATLDGTSLIATGGVDSLTTNTSQLVKSSLAYLRKKTGGGSLGSVGN